MLGREVLLPASLIVAPPEENVPQSSYVQEERTVFVKCISKSVKLWEIQPKQRRPTSTVE